MPLPSESAEVPELLGTWDLVAYEDRDAADGPWTRPFGTPTGHILYARSGGLSVQVVPGPDAPSGAVEIGYVGTFEVADSERQGATVRGVVLHQMRTASDESLFADDPQRPFELTGDELVLGDGTTWRRTLLRRTRH